MRGKHVARAKGGTVPGGFEPDEVPESWLTPSSPSKWLRTEIHGRGVPDFGDGGRLYPMMWPLGSLAHFLVYPGQWQVRVVESRKGWNTKGAIRPSQTRDSHRAAVPASESLGRRMSEAARSSPS